MSKSNKGFVENSNKSKGFVKNNNNKSDTESNNKTIIDLFKKDDRKYDKNYYNSQVYKKELNNAIKKFNIFGPMITNCIDDLSGGNFDIIIEGPVNKDVELFLYEFLKNPEYGIYLFEEKNFNKINQLQINKCLIYNVIYIIPLCYTKVYIPKLRSFNISILCYLHIFDENLKLNFNEIYKIIEYGEITKNDNIEDIILCKLIKTINELNDKNNFFQFSKNIMSLPKAYKKIKETI